MGRYETGVILLAKNTVDNMNGHDFERWCADLLRRNGFSNVTVTPGSGDQGVDVLANKDGKKYAIQCKRYSSKLGNTPVQEVYTGKAVYHCQVAVVMTNNYFTAGAVAAAKATGVLLWDRDTLVKMSRQVPAGRSVRTQPAKPTTVQNQVQTEKEKSKLGKCAKLVILICCLILGFVFAVAEESLWATKYTPINKFRYSIEDGALFIERYKGYSKNIWIAPSYKIDGILYNVKNVGGLSLHRQTKSIIISSGIASMENHIFNGASGLERIYLPSSLQIEKDTGYPFYKYLHADNVTIYCEGTEESLADAFLEINECENISVYYERSLKDGKVSVGNQ